MGDGWWIDDVHYFLVVVVVILMLLDLERTLIGGEVPSGHVSVSRPYISTAGYAHMFLVISFPKTRGSSNGGVAWYKISSQGQGLRARLGGSEW